MRASLGAFGLGPREAAVEGNSISQHAPLEVGPGRYPDFVAHRDSIERSANGLLRGGPGCAAVRIISVGGDADNGGEPVYGGGYEAGSQSVQVGPGLEGSGRIDRDPQDAAVGDYRIGLHRIGSAGGVTNRRPRAGTGHGDVARFEAGIPIGAEYRPVDQLELVSPDVDDPIAHPRIAVKIDGIGDGSSLGPRVDTRGGG